MRWFARTEQLLGAEPLARLGAARVAVFGLGGVGSFAVEALARAARTELMATTMKSPRATTDHSTYGYVSISVKNSSTMLALMPIA